MTATLKLRESRVRRLAARRGLAIARARRRNKDASADGGYRIVDPQSDAVILDGDKGDYSLRIDEVEEFLADPDRVEAIPVANLNAANDR